MARDIFSASPFGLYLLFPFIEDFEQEKALRPRGWLMWDAPRA
jgi:hypothetical protein